MIWHICIYACAINVKMGIDSLEFILNSYKLRNLYGNSKLN